MWHQSEADCKTLVPRRVTQSTERKLERRQFCPLRLRARATLLSLSLEHLDSLHSRFGSYYPLSAQAHISRSHCRLRDSIATQLKRIHTNYFRRLHGRLSRRWRRQRSRSLCRPRADDRDLTMDLAHLRSLLRDLVPASFDQGANLASSDGGRALLLAHHQLLDLERGCQGGNRSTAV